MREQLVQLNSHDVQSNSEFFKIEPDYKAISDISQTLGQDVFGQEKACDQLARAVTRSMAGFSDPRRPEGTFMFLGPTGVGKTEMSKSLSKYLYGDKWEERFLRIDCTQLQESHSVGRLKGAEPSYIGYGDDNILITPDFLKKGGVIVFDEIEKANPAVWKWLLPVMEEGQQKALIPSSGNAKWSAELETLDFAGTYLVFTANVGAEQLHKARMGDSGIGFRTQTQKPDIEGIGKSELRKAFQGMPEFLGRIDSTVVFNELEREDYQRIFYKFLGEINEDQRYGQNYLAVTSELRNYIIDHAVGKGEYGAREIRHSINQYLLDKASEIKFSGVLREGQPLVGDVEDDKVIFWTSDLSLNKQGHPTEAHMPTTPPERRPNLKLIQDGEKNRDAGSFIGNKDLPTEEDTGEEDIAEEKEKKAPRAEVIFYVPHKLGATIDLAITVKQPGRKDLNQIITALPLLENE